MEALMKCGHVAQGFDEDRSPVCVICFGLDAGATEVVSPPDLVDRQARCVYDIPGKGGGGKWRKHTDGDSIVPTKMSLAFLELEPEVGWKPHRRAFNGFDAYYCGCWGWD
jgi:hypothetical protein